MSAFVPEVVVGPGAVLAEGPRWDPAIAKLWWVDTEGGAVHRFDPGSGIDEAHQVDVSPGAILPRHGGGHILIADQSVFTYVWQQDPHPLLDICPGPPQIRLNDASVDDWGRLWVGSYHEERKAGTASWYIVDRDRPSALYTGGTLSNGVAVAPQGDFIYLVDSRERRIYRVQINPWDGSIGERMVWLTLDDAPGVPDGIAVDGDGAVWVAFYFGSSVRRYSSDGVLLRTISLPVQRVTSVAFGGHQLSDLYITSARGHSDEERVAEPLGGALFVVADAGCGIFSQPWNPATAGLDQGGSHK